MSFLVQAAANPIILLARGARMGVAERYAGVNANLLTDDRLFDAVSGNAAVNGVPVTVAAC